MTTYPVADLLTVCAWRRVRFDLVRRQELGRTAGGRSVGRDLGPALWAGEWESVPVTLSQARAVRARLDSLRGVIGTFVAWDLDAATPRDYPAGTGFAASGGVQMLTVGEGGERLRLQNLVAGATLRAGDLLSFTPSAGGRALHRLLADATADGGGQIAFTHVEPAVLTGPGAGAAVSMAPASCLMRLEPGSVSDRPGPGVTRVFSFSAVQDPLA